jgi:cell division protein FtsQ
MRRPSAPAQRTTSRPQAAAPAAPGGQASVPKGAAPVATREPGAREPETARPLELRARRGDSEPRPAHQPAEGARAEQPGGERVAPGLLASFAAWRELRRAVAARRRVERGEARRFTARTRRRRRLQLGIAGFVVLVLGGAVVTAYSPIMALRHIEVVGAHAVPASQLRQALAGELGKPLPLVRQADVRHALDDFRLIESYSTQLEPPSTLVVRITERTPLAVVKNGGSYEVVDQAGVVLSAGSAPQPGLPVVTFPAGERPEKSAGFAAAAAVIAALPESVRATVTAASATSANNVTLSLQGGKQVIWGDADQTELKTADLKALLTGAAGASVYDVSSPRAPITR